MTSKCSRVQAERRPEAGVHHLTCRLSLDDSPLLTRPYFGFPAFSRALMQYSCGFQLPGKLGPPNDRQFHDHNLNRNLKKKTTQ